MESCEIVQQPHALAAAVRIAEKLPRPYAGYLRALAVRAFGDGQEYSAVTAWGRHLSPTKDHTFLHAAYNEPTETRLLSQMTLPHMTFLDIGANRGWFTLMAACRVGPSGRVIAVEPDPRARRLLERTLHANDQLHNVTVVGKAAGRQPGTAAFVMTTEPALAHLHHRGIDVGATVQVEVDTVDNMMEEMGIGRLDVAKLDIEGAEVDALAGMTATLKRHRPIILVEVESHLMARYGAKPTDIVDLLGDRYRCEWVCWEHDRLEPLTGHCPSGRNLLCRPI